jgi:hypothetical protein
MRWAIVFLCATACLPTVDFDPPAICEVLPFRAPPSVIPRGVVSELDVPLIDGNCLPSGVTANVEIYDSENLPVQFELDLRSAGRSAIARLSVLPQRPGPLQIFVTFEPGLGRTTRTLFVAEPALPPLPDFSVATPCTTEALTTQGTWICQLASTITVWRDGMLLQTFPSLAMAARRHVHHGGHPHQLALGRAATGLHPRLGQRLVSGRGLAPPHRSAQRPGPAGPARPPTSARPSRSHRSGAGRSRNFGRIAHRSAGRHLALGVCKRLELFLLSMP